MTDWKRVTEIAADLVGATPAAILWQPRSRAVFTADLILLAGLRHPEWLIAVLASMQDVDWGADQPELADKLVMLCPVARDDNVEALR